MIFCTDYKLPKQRKEREDKGKSRAKYDNTLPKSYVSLMKRCNKKGLKLGLTIDEFTILTSKDCHYCGASSKIGIDRVDSSGDYTTDNCVPCCFKCNMSKYTFSPEDFLKHVEKIYHFQRNRSQLLG